MAIKLRVISEHQRALGEHRTRVFGVNGGTVGRAPDNDWVLPDARRVVSGHHCVVQYHGGRYWLNDISTNGVYVNDEDEPVTAMGGRVELHDGDRLRIGDYDIVVSIDQRIDFLPAAAEEHSAAKHLDAGIGHSLDLDSLLSPRDAGESGSVSMRNAFGVKVDTGTRAALLEALQRSVDGESPAAFADRQDSVVPPFIPSATQPVQPRPVPQPTEHGAPAPQGGAAPEWALRTRQITREELTEALARRQGRADARERTVPFHQQAGTWADLRSSVHAFCRGAGIEVSALTPEAQSMLPLVAGQLLREVVVGLNDIALARAGGAASGKAAKPPAAAGGSSNPLRTSSSVEQALVRLFESHNRLYAGPVDSMRDVLQEGRDHEAALAAGIRAGLAAVLEQLSPASVADQFEQGRARLLAPGQDPRPKYWEFYGDFYRLLRQQAGPDELPHAFVEALGEEYSRVRASLRAKRS